MLDFVFDVIGTIVIGGVVESIWDAVFTNGLSSVPDEHRQQVVDVLVLAAIWGDDRVDEREHEVLTKALGHMNLQSPEIEAAIRSAIERVSPSLDEAGARAIVHKVAVLLTDDKPREAFAKVLAHLEQQRASAPAVSLLDLFATEWGWPAEQVQELREKAAG
jgi:hypothetical protein